MTTSDSHPNYGASFKFQLCNNLSGTCSVPTKTLLDEESWSILNAPVTMTIPVGAPWLPPYRGTRGPQGLPVRAILMTTTNVAGQIDYQVTISKVRRHDYNLGGTSIGDAPLATFGDTYRGSIHPWEPGQYFKVHLEPGQGLAVQGKVLGHYPNSTQWDINILDASHVLLTKLTFGVAGTQQVPIGPIPFTSGTYLNSTNAARDVYLQFVAKWYPVHDFELVIQPKGQCPVPSGENVIPIGFLAEPFELYGSFDQQLLPPAGNPSASFASRKVTERGTGAVNNCITPGAPFAQDPPYLNNSSWGVRSDNKWGPDTFFQISGSQILWYRENRPMQNLPVGCDVQITQIMSIATCDGNNVDYAQHLVKYGFDATNVTVVKGTAKPISTVWP